MVVTEKNILKQMNLHFNTKMLSMLYGKTFYESVHKYCIQTLTRHSWIHYTDCWILK